MDTLATFLLPAAMLLAIAAGGAALWLRRRRVDPPPHRQVESEDTLAEPAPPAAVPHLEHDVDGAAARRAALEATLAQGQESPTSWADTQPISELPAVSTFAPTEPLALEAEIEIR